MYVLLVMRTRIKIDAFVSGLGASVLSWARRASIAEWTTALLTIQADVEANGLPFEFRAEADRPLCTIVLIEPRKHMLIRPVLLALVQAYAKVPLEQRPAVCVMHGPSSAKYVRVAAVGLTGLTFKALESDNLRPKVEYSKLLVTAEWYAQFTSPYVCILQTDALIFRPLEPYIQDLEAKLGGPVAYVGAPGAWPGLMNGGLSVRHVKSLRSLLTEASHKTPWPRGQPEDLYICRLLQMAQSAFRIPRPSDASTFSVEWRIFGQNDTGRHEGHKDHTITERQAMQRGLRPLGLHRAYMFHGPEYIKYLFSKL
jgi:hypothetical protein